MEKEIDEISQLIKDYADIYNRFEEIQKKGNLILPGGDQKTGVIGEYYAMCYIKHKYPNVEQIEFAKSGASYDIEYKTNDGIIRVQVKTVSDHSRTRRIAPLNPINDNNENAFDVLYLIALNTNFIPTGFYIIEYESIKWNDITKPLKGLTMKGTSFEKDFKGSKVFNFKDYNNLFKEMNEAINMK